MLQDNLKKQAPIFTKIRPKAKFNNLTFLLFSRSYHSSSSLQQKRLTNLERSNITLDDNLLISGMISVQGVIHLVMFICSTKDNTRIVFRQGSINAAYFGHLYSLYQKFVSQ